MLYSMWQMYIIQALEFPSWTKLTLTELCNPVSFIFTYTPKPEKKCVFMFVCVKHIKNRKVNPFELAARLATGWINIHVRGNWYTPFSSRRASRGKNSSYTMDRDGLLLRLSEMWASSSLQPVPWTDHSPKLTQWLKHTHTHSLFFQNSLQLTNVCVISLIMLWT